MRTIKGYKLFRVRKDGTIGPLFINQRQRIEVGKWMDAEDHPTKGFAHRPGWHATLKPVAPHLSTKGRVWCRVAMTKTRKFNRPQSQGGTWVLAQKLKVTRVLPKLQSDLDLISEADLERSLIFGVDEEGCHISMFRKDGRTLGTDLERHFESWEDVQDFFLALFETAGWEYEPRLMCSSSMDFPEEYNEDPDVLALAKKIRAC